MSTQIAQTAPISLLTGLPGSGKSLRLAYYIKNARDNGEHVYVCNLNGLNISGVTPWSDPHAWQMLPAGSVLVVDEAQEFFPARRSGDPPATVAELKKIRHYGIRLILATQQPTYIDTHVRGLVGFHEHLVRKNGKQACTIFRAHEVIDDPKSSKARRDADNEIWSYPREIFDCYKSSELHVIKRTTAARTKRGVMMAAGAALLLGAALWGFFASKPGAELAATEAAGVPLAAPADTGRPGAAKAEPMTAEAFAAQLTPRIDAAPWSAPIFDGRQAVAEPKVYCMSSGVEGTESCKCITEQGTRYQLEVNACRQVARWGQPYNPFQRSPDERQERVAQQSDPKHEQAPEREDKPRHALPSRFRIVNGEIVL